jgi:hypothetical protein
LKNDNRKEIRNEKREVQKSTEKQKSIENQESESQKSTENQEFESQKSTDQPKDDSETMGVTEHQDQQSKDEGGGSTPEYPTDTPEHLEEIRGLNKTIESYQQQIKTLSEEKGKLSEILKLQHDEGVEEENILFYSKLGPRKYVHFAPK